MLAWGGHQAALQSGMWQACLCVGAVPRTLGVCLRRSARFPPLAVDLVGVLLELLEDLSRSRDSFRIPARRAGGPVGGMMDSGRPEFSSGRAGSSIRV